MWECIICDAPINSLEAADEHYKDKHPLEWEQIEAEREAGDGW